MLRRYPAFLWIPIYVGSIFILNGGHPEWSSGQLAVGIALIVIGCAGATYLAIGPWPGRPRPKGMEWAFLGVAAFYAICAIAAAAGVGPTAGLAVLLAGTVPLTAVAVWVAHARSKTAGRDEREFQDAEAEDHEDPVPGIGLDSSRPLGDTPAAHDEIIPEDLPKDHPARHAAERQAEALGGTTPGHAEGGAAAVGPGRPGTTDDLVPPEEAHRGAASRADPGASKRDDQPGEERFKRRERATKRR